MQVRNDKLKIPWFVIWILLVSYYLILGVVDELGSSGVNSLSPGRGRGGELTSIHGTALHVISAILLLQSLRLREGRVNQFFFLTGVTAWLGGDLLTQGPLLIALTTLVYFALFQWTPSRDGTPDRDQTEASIPPSSYRGG